MQPSAGQPRAGRGSAGRRSATWLAAALVVGGPLAQLPGNAATCEGTTVGRDGWTRISAPAWTDDFAPQAIAAHAILPSRLSTLFVSNGFEVMRSTDGGCKWSRVIDRSTRVDVGPVRGESGVLGPSMFQELDTASFNTASTRVYLLARGSLIPGVLSVNDSEPAASPLVFVSDDGGATFRSANNGLPAIGEPGRIRVADGVDSVAYVSVRDPILGGDALYITRNAGQSWTRTSEDTLLPSQEGSIVDFAIDPGRPDQVWAWDETALLHSTDAGATFAEVTQVTAPVATVEFTARGIGLLSAVRVYHLGAPTADVSASPYTTWAGERAPGLVLSVAQMPQVGVRLLGTAQQVFTFYPNTRTGRIVGPVEISPIGVDPADLEAAYDARRNDLLVVGRIPTHLVLRDPRFPPPPLPPVPPIGALSDCRAAPLGEEAFRPSVKEVVLRPGERRRVGYDLSLPPVPSDLDVNFMLDTTGSMSGVIAGLRQDIKGIVEDICAQRVPVQFGLADFREFPGPFGGGAVVGGGNNPGQYPYKRRLPISPVGPELRRAIGGLDTGGGATDGSDAALEAVFQAATGAGRKELGTGRELIPRGQGAGWRPDSLKVIVLAIDTSWREATPGYPGPAYETVVKELRLRGIKVVGLSIGVRTATGHLETNQSQLSRMATSTRTLAPVGGTDCDGDGVAEIPGGGPLVCVLNDPGRDSVELGPAMAGLLSALEDRASIALELVADPVVLADGGVLQRDNVDVKKPSRLAFDSSFVCEPRGFGRTFPVTVNATSRGRILATTQVTVRCGVPKPPDPPARLFIAPVVAAALPPPPPPPAVVTVTQLQPNPNPNPQVNPQAQLQPNLGVVGQEQEEVNLQLATLTLEDDAPEPGLAMSVVRSEDSTVQVAAALLAVGLTAGAAYGLGYRRRPEQVPIPVRSD